MGNPEDAVIQAARVVRESKRRVVRLTALIERGRAGGSDVTQSLFLLDLLRAERRLFAEQR